MIMRLGASTLDDIFFVEDNANFLHENFRKG